MSYVPETSLICTILKPRKPTEAVKRESSRLFLGVTRSCDICDMWDRLPMPPLLRWLGLYIFIYVFISAFQISFQKIFPLFKAWCIVFIIIYRFPTDAEEDSDVTIPTPPISIHQRSLHIKLQHGCFCAASNHLERPSELCNTMRKPSSTCGQLPTVSFHNP